MEPHVQGSVRIGSDGPAAHAAERIRGRTIARRQDHGGRGPCAFCDGYGDVVNPGNGDPAVKVTDWLAPVGCPRCGQTGKEPNP
jgi:prepilin-type processing-associated H-X9-DG protein